MSTGVHSPIFALSSHQILTWHVRRLWRLWNITFCFPFSTSSAKFREILILVKPLSSCEFLIYRVVANRNQKLTVLIICILHREAWFSHYHGKADDVVGYFVSLCPFFEVTSQTARILFLRYASSIQLRIWYLILISK